MIDDIFFVMSMTCFVAAGILFLFIVRFMWTGIKRQKSIRKMIRAAVDRRDCIYPDCLIGRIRACEHACPFEEDMRREELDRAFDEAVAQFPKTLKYLQER